MDQDENLRDRNRSTLSSHGHKQSHWTPPPTGWVKCNFDSSFIQGRDYTGTWWLIRNDSGRILLSGCAKLQQSHSSLQAEVLGFLNALQSVWVRGFRYVWFESDNLELTELINRSGDHNKIGTLLYDIRLWMSKLPHCSLGHINRERNTAADKLAKQASIMDSLFQTFTVPPRWLLKYLYYPFTV